MRSFQEQQTLKGETIRWGEELRRHVRFRVFNSFFSMGADSLEVYDISEGGFSIKTSSLEIGSKVEGILKSGTNSFQVKAEVKRKGSVTGLQFLEVPEDLLVFLSVDLFKKENFKVSLSKTNRNMLLYENASGNIFLGFKIDGLKVQEFFLSFQNVFTMWKEGEGIATGVILEESTSLKAWENDSLLQKDFVVDKNKIQLFEDIIEHNEKINSSLKEWIRENLDLLVV